MSVLFLPLGKLSNALIDSYSQVWAFCINFERHIIFYWSFEQPSNFVIA
jgi:hypothetical protein